MTAIHLQAPHGGWRRVSHRARRASRVVQRALAAVRDWRRRLQDPSRSSAVDERKVRDSGICRSDELTSTASKSSATLGLISCTSHPFNPRGGIKQTR